MFIIYPIRLIPMGLRLLTVHMHKLEGLQEQIATGARQVSHVSEAC